MIPGLGVQVAMAQAWPKPSYLRALQAEQRAVGRWLSRSRSVFWPSGFRGPVAKSQKQVIKKVAARKQGALPRLAARVPRKSPPPPKKSYQIKNIATAPFLTNRENSKEKRRKAGRSCRCSAD